jgi:hypothetical protein
VAGTQHQPQSNGQAAVRLLSFARVPVQAPVTVGTLHIHSSVPVGRLVVFGLALVDTQGTVKNLMAPGEAKFTEIAHDQNLVVLRNNSAFPRAFVVRRARVVPSGNAVDSMQRASFDPSREVIVERGCTSRARPACSVAGQACWRTSFRSHYSVFTAERIRQRRHTDPSFLVVTDAYFPGWHAYRDGVETPNSPRRLDVSHD